MPIPVLGAFQKLLNVLKLLSELSTIIPILKMKKLRLREAKQLAQGHTVRNPF